MITTLKYQQRQNLNPNTINAANATNATNNTNTNNITEKIPMTE